MDNIEFIPNFRITDRILNNIAKIYSSREIVLSSYLVPKWEVTLRREAILKSAHASTAIEGNPLSFEEVTALSEGREVMATRKSKQEVLNYLHVLMNIEETSSEGKIDEKLILELHGHLAKDVLDNPKDVGAYRDRQVIVGNRVTGEIIFTPPTAAEVPGLMKGFVDWLASSDAAEVNTVLLAGIVHYEFVRIHPFMDGNGRCARTLATLVLLLRDFDTKRFFALDDYYDSDRISYYKALQSVDPTERDLTRWLLYFSEGVKVSINAVKERVLRLSLGSIARINEARLL